MGATSNLLRTGSNPNPQMRVEDFSQTTRKLKNTHLRFILTELAAGLTFASVARNAGRSKENKEESRARARAAYDSVLRFRRRVVLTEKESERVQSKSQELKGRLEALGEKF